MERVEVSLGKGARVVRATRYEGMGRCDDEGQMVGVGVGGGYTYKD